MFICLLCLEIKTVKCFSDSNSSKFETELQLNDTEFILLEVTKPIINDSNVTMRSHASVVGDFSRLEPYNLNTVFYTLTLSFNYKSRRLESKEVTFKCFNEESVPNNKITEQKIVSFLCASEFEEKMNELSNTESITLLKVSDSTPPEYWSDKNLKDASETLSPKNGFKYLQANNTYLEGCNDLNYRVYFTGLSNIEYYPSLTETHIFKFNTSFDEPQLESVQCEYYFSIESLICFFNLSKEKLKKAKFTTVQEYNNTIYFFSTYGKSLEIPPSGLCIRITDPIMDYSKLIAIVVIVLIIVILIVSGILCCVFCCRKKERYVTGEVNNVYGENYTANSEGNVMMKTTVFR